MRCSESPQAQQRCSAVLSQNAQSITYQWRPSQHCFQALDDTFVNEDALGAPDFAFIETTL